MTKPLLLITALSAQILPAQSYFQQPGWIGVNGSTTISVHMNRPDGQTGPVAGRPFSGSEVRHTTQTLADGTHVDHTDTSTFYRDAQGRMRTESADRVLIYDPVAGFTYNLDPKNKIYEKWPLHQGTMSTTIAVAGGSTWINSTSSAGPPPVVETTHSSRISPHAEPVAQSSTENLPPQSVNGVMARGSRVTMTIPAGAFGNDREVKVVNERWYSDELQVLVKSSNSDPRFGVTTYELTNIVQTSPDPGLFQVPGDYAERQAGRH